MHELSITQGILSIALEKASQVQAKRVARINLVIGGLSGVVGQCVKFYFDFLSKDTIAAEAELSFHQPATELSCRHCKAVFSPQNDDWSCPSCGQQTVGVVSGYECFMESIEVD